MLFVLQKLEVELVKKWNFRQNTWFPWNRGPFCTYKILILRWISIYILAINTKLTNSNEHSQVSRRASNDIPSGLRVPLINNANCSLVFIWFELCKRNQNGCTISALVRKTVFWRALNQENTFESTRPFVGK